MSFKAVFKNVFSIASAFVLVSVLVLQGATASAAPVNGAKVSFTFDDGYKQNVTQVAPALAKYGYSATSYVTSNFLGTQGYMSWAEVQKLQNQYKWEIGGHSMNHLLSTTLSPADLTYEVQQNYKDLVARGLNPTSFATPFGDYNNNVMAEVAKSYAVHRPFHDKGYNTDPYSDYLIQVQQVQSGVSVATVKQYIDQAAANGQWLVLVFHNVKNNPSRSAGSYDYAISNLEKIAAYVKAKSLPVVNMSQGIIKGTNMFANGSFTSGISDGWTTDSSNTITSDTTTKGSYPEAKASVKLVAGATNTHLFSPLTTVNPSTTYTLKTFINMTAISSSELGYYIDEYDSNGNWISGQYKKAENNVFVSRRNVPYTPTSTSVSKIRFQIIVPANSGITAYIDNVELIAR